MSNAATLADALFAWDLVEALSKGVWPEADSQQNVLVLSADLDRGVLDDLPGDWHVPFRSSMPARERYALLEASTAQWYASIDHCRCTYAAVVVLMPDRGHGVGTACVTADSLLKEVLNIEDFLRRVASLQLALLKGYVGPNGAVRYRLEETLDVVIHHLQAAERAGLISESAALASLPFMLQMLRQNVSVAIANLAAHRSARP